LSYTRPKGGRIVASSASCAQAGGQAPRATLRSSVEALPAKQHPAAIAAADRCQNALIQHLATR